MAEASEGGKAQWFDPPTRTLFAALAATGAAITALVFWNSPQGARLTGIAAAAFVFVFVGFLLAAQLLRLSAVWTPYREAMSARAKDRTPSQRARVEHGFIEFFVYLAASLGGLSLVAYTASAAGLIGPMPLEITGASLNLAHLCVFLLVFAAAFVPLLTGFVLQARLEARMRSETGTIEILRNDVVSEFSFWTTAVLVAGLVALAWAAAGGMFQMKEDFGVFITFVVLLVFFVIILAPHVMRALNNFTEERDAVAVEPITNGVGAISPGKLMSWLDSILVRFVAPLSGATQNGPLVPHLLVIVVILPLSALGFVLSAPWGLVPISTAMLIAVALGRRWAWVEEDRETASRLRTTRGKDIHIGFDNDLKDEALLSYASLFVLVPLALHQLQGWTNSFTFDAQYSSQNAFVDWLRFFGAELAKAVPFVDWWEIYNVSIETPYDAANSENALAKHLTFAARAMVDLVIMAALFQAIGIWQRSRTDRRFYAAGEMDVFDPFTETAFFERGMRYDAKSEQIIPKSDFRALVNDHVQKRLARNWDGNPYSPRRLSELVKSDNPDVRAGAEWMIDKYDVLVGSPVDQLRQLSQRLLDGADTKLKRGNDNRTFARKQKIELERILQELQDELDTFEQADVPHIVAALEVIRGVPEFAFAELQAIELLRKRPSKRSTHSLMKMVMHKSHFGSDQGREMWDQFKLELGSAKPLYLGQAPSRVDVFHALRQHGMFYFAQSAYDRLDEIAAFMDWMSQETDAKFGVKGDRSAEVRKLAREIESELRALLRM